MTIQTELQNNSLTFYILYSDKTGFSGIDKIDGGPGNDTVSYHHPYAISGVTVNLSTGKGTGGHAEGDTYQNIENILGSRHDDILIGDGNDNSIFGLEGEMMKFMVAVETTRL